jgi:hypothetical protein
MGTESKQQAHVFGKGIGMDLERVLAELRRERDAIERAILNLEQLGRSTNGRAVHPPDLTTKGSIVKLPPKESS